jgi:hypothetical protein
MFGKEHTAFLHNFMPGLVFMAVDEIDSYNVSKVIKWF